MRHTVVLGCLLLALTTAVSAADDLVIRTSVDPEEAWIGQRIFLTVDVLAADAWAQITDVDDVEIPGTYILRTETQGNRLNETISGTTYTGQRYTMSLFCQRPGRVELPPIPVTVTIKQWGAGASETVREVTTPVTSFTCRTPAGAEDIRGLISTPRLTAVQTWSSEPDTVDLGDAVTRTVTLGASDVSAMAFPPMRHLELDGIGVYPGEPTVNDEVDHSDLRGERIETVTYVFERPGTVTLPAIELPWWNLSTETLERIELAGLEFVVVGEVVDDVATETAASPPPDPRRSARDIVVILVVLAVIFWFGRDLIRRFQAWLAARRESEATYFKPIGPALKSGDPVRSMSAIMRWLDRLELETSPARLSDFLQRYGDDETRAAADSLGRALGSGGAFAEAKALGPGLKRARNRWRRARRHQERAAVLLPDLNRPRG